jgi:uncharacterized protein (DUF1330 family)
MKAYVIALETVHDQAMFGEYAKGVAATLLAFEGRFVARGGHYTVLEGEWQNPRTVIIEFPSREAAQGWYDSADYQKIIGLRHNSSSGNLVILDGA